MRTLDIKVVYDPERLAAAPRQGPLVVVANHPFGVVDGLVLCHLVATVRPDCKVGAMSTLCRVPEVRDHVLPINFAPTREAAAVSARSRRAARAHLDAGGCLVIFPAGQVAALDLAVRQIRESAWKDTVVRMIRRSRATAVPLFVHGTNSPAFHLAGLVHPTLRTALLPRELVNKQGRRIHIRIGKAISPAGLDATGDDSSALAYLQWRTSLLGRASIADRRRLLAWLRMAAKPIEPGLSNSRLEGLLSSSPRRI